MSRLPLTPLSGAASWFDVIAFRARQLEPVRAREKSGILQTRR